MTTEIKNQLDTIVGRKISYKAENLTVQKYKEVNSLIVVKCEEKTLNFYHSEIQEFLNAVTDPIEKEVYKFSPKNQNAQIMLPIPQENTTIRETLMEAIQKVKEDPNFIKQAKAICDITNTVINVQKLELDMVKLHKENL